MSEHTPEIGPPERRKGYNEIKRTLEEDVDAIERCFKQWLVRGLVAFSIIGILCAISLFGFSLILYNESQSDDQVKKIAERADTRAEKLWLDAVLNKEKICSETSNQQVTCQALFERLDGSLSKSQRVRLACSITEHLEGPTAEALRRDNPQCRR